MSKSKKFDDQEPPTTFTTHYTAFQHPVFEALHDREGSGWYTFTERIGLGGIFRLTSRGVIPFNPPQDSPVSAPYHDEYDILRAVDAGYIHKVSL